MEYNWTIFARLKYPSKYNFKISDIVKKVEFDLSETIKDLEVTVFSENQDKRKVKVSRADEISVSYRGIGRCNLPITVHFKQHLNILPIKIN